MNKTYTGIMIPSEKHILIADSQYLISRSLAELLSEKYQFVVREIVTNRKDLERSVRESRLSLLIIDVNHFDIEGPSDLKTLLGSGSIPVLVLTNSLTRSELAGLDSIGIKNILFKSSTETEILTAVDHTLQGKKFYGREVMEILLEKGEWKKVIQENTSLTAAEIEIVKLIAEGMTTKEIASRKNVSFHTIMTHRKNIFRKARVNNASELVMFAIRAGIIDTIEYQI
jgi:DNA-binding NarL/FixJ family response regulator